jgi:histidine ammonia-lyase
MSMSGPPVVLGLPISLESLEEVARRGRAVTVDPEARKKVEAIDAIAAAGRRRAQRVRRQHGLRGARRDAHRGERDIRALQKTSCAATRAGVGPDLGEAEVRGMMLLRAQVLALGHSGVRARRSSTPLDRDAEPRRDPRIPAQGSVGASGDLAPLAHLALVLIGEGEARARRRAVPGAEALARAGLVAPRARGEGGPRAHQRHAVHDRARRARAAGRRAPRDGSPTSPAR